MTPRPILKSLRRKSGAPGYLNVALPFSSSSSTLFSPHVHFPPTPTLTATFTAHSAEVYDRKPILVAPNDCNIPDRDDRVYLELPSAPHRIRPSSGRRRPRSSTPSISTPSVKQIGSYFHPRAYEACEKDKVIVEEEVFLSSSPSSSSSSSPSSSSCSSSDNSDSDISSPNSLPELTFSSPSASEISDSEWSPRVPPPLISLPLHVPKQTQFGTIPTIVTSPQTQTFSPTALSFLPYPGGRLPPPSDILEEEEEEENQSSRRRKLKRRNSARLFSQRRGSNDLSIRPLSLDEGCLGGF